MKMQKNLFCFLIAVLFGQVQSATVFGQLAGENSPKDYTSEALQNQFLIEAESYDIESTTKRKMELKKEPLLNWQNPERPATLGSLFVWFDGTRPAVFASVFTFQNNQLLFRKHELISLFPDELDAKLEGDTVWNPKPADLKGLNITIAIAPHATEAGRLTQMRSITREMLGKHYPREGGAAQELRLMSQPLCRYRSEKDRILDGAIFALAVGTDPEILLMVEARQTDGGTQWKVVPFRSHFDALELQYKGEIVWQAPLTLPLMSTGPMELPFARDPFFVFYPTKPLPSAGELNKLLEKK